MIFIQLTSLDGDDVVFNSEDIECIHVGKIDRKGNTATVVEFNFGGYFCVSESISEVVKRIGSPMFIKLHDYDLSEIVFNVERITCIATSLLRKTKNQVVVCCRSGHSYVVFESVSYIYQRLEPALFRNSDD